MTKPVQNRYRKNKTDTRNAHVPIRYPTNVRILAAEISSACDCYLCGEMEELELRQLIFHYASNVPHLLFDSDNSGGYRKTIELRIGIKRLHLVRRMLDGWQLQLPQ